MLSYFILLKRVLYAIFVYINEVDDGLRCMYAMYFWGAEQKIIVRFCSPATLVPLAIMASAFTFAFYLCQLMVNIVYIYARYTFVHGAEIYHSTKVNTT